MFIYWFIFCKNVRLALCPVVTCAVFDGEPSHRSLATWYARNGKDINKCRVNKNIKAVFLLIVAHWARDTGSGASSGTCQQHLNAVWWCQQRPTLQKKKNKKKQAQSTSCFKGKMAKITCSARSFRHVYIFRCLRGGQSVILFLHSDRLSIFFPLFFLCYLLMKSDRLLHMKWWCAGRGSLDIQDFPNSGPWLLCKKIFGRWWKATSLTAAGRRQSATPEVDAVHLSRAYFTERSHSTLHNQWTNILLAECRNLWDLQNVT